MTVILLIASAGNTWGSEVSLNVMPTGKENIIPTYFFINMRGRKDNWKVHVKAQTWAVTILFADSNFY